jgi:UDP-GlcNAc:undecaprenyl-phosphate GlcNAc-1-phosphate transferase
MEYLLTFNVTILFCFMALSALYPFAVKLNLVDCPDHRKTHIGKIPLVGGIAMFVGFAAILLISASDLSQVSGILIASSIVIVVGVLDDRNNISVRFRFLMQILAVLVMTSFSGVVLSDLGGLLGADTLLLGVLAIPVTVIAAVGVMNAMNMIDGIDGLAGMSALICFLAVLFLQFLSGDIELIPLMFVAVLIPFLPFNLRAVNKIFMGDAGSMFLGLGVVWVLVDSCQGKDAIMNTVTALWLFSVPVIDTVAIMFRRVMKGQSPFMPDREHLHHIFLRAGFSARSTLYIMSLLSVFFAAIGIMGDIYQVPEWIMFSGFMLVFFVYLWGISHSWVLLRYVRQKLLPGVSV